jgi:hypothetical protein
MKVKLRKITFEKQTRYEIGIPKSVIDLLKLWDADYLSLDIDTENYVIFLREARIGQ